MLPATFKLCAAISYRHLRNMTGEGPGDWDAELGEPLSVGCLWWAAPAGFTGPEEAGSSGDALPIPCHVAFWVSCFTVSTTLFATRSIAGVRGG